MPSNTSLSEMVRDLNRINYDAVDPAELQDVRERLEAFQRSQAKSKKNKLASGSKPSGDCSCVN